MSLNILSIRRYALAIGLCWTLSVVCSFAWLCYQERRNVIGIALAEARATYQKDTLYRRWATKHGGVYVPATADTPPNPYLAHIPERDLLTPSGKLLTLVNPAYMTRQVFEFANKDGKSLARGHITSLKPIRPENAPDPWEAEALQAFETGAKEVVAVQVLDGRRYVRMMRPFVTENGCLKCHAKQGYKVGDIRGGVSASVPIEDYARYARRLIAGGAATHGIIWLLGIGIIGFGQRALSRSALDMQESEERYRTVADFTSDWEYWLGPDGSMRYVSPACQYVCGYSADEFYANPSLLDEVVHPEDLPRFKGHSHVELPDGRPQALDFRIVTRDGEIRWVAHNCRPVYDREGRENGRRASNRDITDRKRAEEALHLQAVMLEEEIAERQKAHEGLQVKTAALEQEIEERQVAQQNLEEQTVELEQEIAERKRAERESLHLREQLLHAQKMEAIGLFAGGVAHDFNNILAVIMGYGELLELRLPEGMERERARQIMKAAHRAAELTRGLLAFGKKQTFTLTCTDINRVVEENSSFLKRVIGEEIELVTELAPAPLLVQVDISQIQQVLMNHATNAREAMPGGGRLTLSVRSEMVDEDFIAMQGYGTPGEYAVIRIADTGAGMDRETVKRIFEPFFTTKSKGTGLGLAITHGIVTQHKGFLRCESKPGEGTSFDIFLPLTSEENVLFPAGNGAAAAGNGAAAAPATLRGSETILLAEDDPFVREMTTGCLEANGYRVLQAEDGAVAVEMFKEHQEEIDLVMLDAITPRLTGKQAWDEISALRPGVKALFVSGYTNDIISGKIAIDYSVPFVSKPLAPSALLRKVREVLDAK
jgi:PAS domain S-box-containing protein